MPKPNTLAFDRGSVRRIDQDGRLHVEITNISKANVCPYLGSEIPGCDALGLAPDKIYKLLRDPAELEKAAATFNNIPLLSDHVAVSASDPQKEIVVGSTGTDAAFKAPYLRNSLVVWDAAAIAGIESDEQRDLSCAYRYTPDMTPGTYKGIRYDGVMRDIRGNHVALVATGRAGPDVVVGDSQPMEIPFMSTKAKPLSRRATLAKGALLGALTSKLAADAMPNLGTILAGVTAENWKNKKAGILAAIKPKLATDADLEGLVNLLDTLDGESDGEESDDDEPIATDEPGDPLQEILALLKQLVAGKTAEDEFPPEKEKIVEKEPDKKAMDAALKAVEQATVERMNAIREAERIVRPHIGELATAMDSAAAVFKLALDAAKIDLAGVPESAYGAMIKMLPPPGGAPKVHVAMDSGVSAEITAFLKK